MTRAFRRDLAYGAALVALIAAYGVSGALPSGVKAALAVAACLVVAVHVARSDEVEQAVAYRAAALAFAVVTAAAVAAPLLGLSGLVGEWAHLLWAGLFASYMASWIVVRSRRG